VLEVLRCASLDDFMVWSWKVSDYRRCLRCLQQVKH